jgi:hypothetical protein
MASGSSANECLVINWFENLGAGNFDVLKSMLHPDATWKVQERGIQGSGAHKGPTGII